MVYEQYLFRNPFSRHYVTKIDYIWNCHKQNKADNHGKHLFFKVPQHCNDPPPDQSKKGHITREVAREKTGKHQKERYTDSDDSTGYFDKQVVFKFPQSKSSMNLESLARSSLECPINFALILLRYLGFLTAIIVSKVLATEIGRYCSSISLNIS